jgi:hypothetical protein
LYELSHDGKLDQSIITNLANELLRPERLRWKDRCFFCGDPFAPWQVDGKTWIKLEPMLDIKPTCQECLAAAWNIMGYSHEPLVITVTPTPEEEDA